MIDRDASVEATKENAQRSLGRPLTASEESAIETAIDSEVSSEQNLGCMSSLLAPFLVLCGVLWFFQKATEFAVELYMTFADPYVMWMIQPHTDSVLNMSLQIYLWIILPPILICLFAILFLPMLSGAVMFGISLLLGEIMKTGIGSGFFALSSLTFFAEMMSFLSNKETLIIFE